MLISEIKKMLKASGMPVTYYQWQEKNVPGLPYLVWLMPESDNIAADDKVYKHVEELDVELYANPRDFAAEEAFENVLNAAGLVWNKSNTYISSERMYETIYTMDVLIEPEPASNEPSEEEN